MTEEADFNLFQHFGFQCGRDVDKFQDFQDAKKRKEWNFVSDKGGQRYGLRQGKSDFGFGVSSAICR